jgi:hypothetical protein
MGRFRRTGFRGTRHGAGVTWKQPATRRRLSTWPAAGGLVACGQGHAEHIVDVPLEAGEGDHDAGRRGEHEQLDPVTVDQGLAEVDAELKVVVERPQPARGSQEAVAGAEDRPAVLAVGPQY